VSSIKCSRNLHGSRYISEFLQNHGFNETKELRFLASNGIREHDDLVCEAYVARRCVDTDHCGT